MLIAALGDVHGQWRQAAGLVISACAQAGVEPADLAMILQVGDAEPLRSEAEIAQVPGPKHYRKLGDFPEVVSGDIVMAAPLYFIAGNHEPFESLDADGGLIQGHGDLAPNVTYLGRAGVVTIDGLRIGFLSGIYGEATYRRSREGTLERRVGKHAVHYTAQEYDDALSAVQPGVDVLLTHDWPSGIAEKTGYFGEVGDERVRALIELSGALLSLHGHMHFAHRATIGVTEVACLTIVSSYSSDPFASVGLWDINPVARKANRLV